MKHAAPSPPLAPSRQCLAPDQMYNRMYIDGTWTEASDGARIDIINPATEEKIDSVPAATSADLDRALAAADRGWRSWREIDAWTRSAAVRRVAALVRGRVETIAGVLTEEQGKPLAEARAEVVATADQFDWYADEARRMYGRIVDGHSREHRLLVLRQPIGPRCRFQPVELPRPSTDAQNCSSACCRLLAHSQACRRGTAHSALPRSSVSRRGHSSRPSQCGHGSSGQD